MFKLNKDIQKALETVGSFNVSVDETKVTVQRRGIVGEEWKHSFLHNDSDVKFVRNFREYANYFKNNYQFMNGKFISDFLQKTASLLEIELLQIRTLKMNQKMGSPLSNKLIRILNESGIKIVNIWKEHECEDVNNNFTSVTLNCFSYDENDYLVNLKFRDGLDLETRFNTRFKAATQIDMQAEMETISSKYRQDKAQALKELADLVSKQDRLSLTAEKIDALYDNLTQSEQNKILPVETDKVDVLYSSAA